MSSLGHNIPLERNRWFQDQDDVWSVAKRMDEKVEVPLNWADVLEDGETISGVAYVDNGVTRNSTSNTTTTTTTTVTGVGQFEITLTLSTGRILQQLRRFYSTDGRGWSRPHDY